MTIIYGYIHCDFGLRNNYIALSVSVCVCVHLKLYFFHAHVNFFCDILQTMEIEVSDVHILEHQSAARLQGNFPEDSTHHHSPHPLPPQPSLHYVHFTSDRIASLLQQVCQLLGRHGTLPIIVDHLLEKLRLSSSTHGKELLLILSNVLLGATSQRERGRRERTESADDEMFVLVEGLLEELVAPSNWDRSQQVVSNFDAGDGESFWREGKITNTKVGVRMCSTYCKL